MSASAPGTPVPSVVHLPHNVELPVIFYQGQPVITLAMMDKAHRRPEGTAHRNFKANRSKLIEGEDYFRRNSSEAKQELGITAPNGLILLTQTGYLMLVKSFTDDLAWQVQRELVKNYFRSKRESPLPVLNGQLVVNHFDDGTQKFSISGFYRHAPTRAMSAAIGLAEFARDVWKNSNTDILPEPVFPELKDVYTRRTAS